MWTSAPLPAMSTLAWDLSIAQGAGIVTVGSFWKLPATVIPSRLVAATIEGFGLAEEAVGLGLPDDGLCEAPGLVEPAHEVNPAARVNAAARPLRRLKWFQSTETGYLTRTWSVDDATLQADRIKQRADLVTG